MYIFAMKYALKNALICTNMHIMCTNMQLGNVNNFQHKDAQIFTNIHKYALNMEKICKHMPGLGEMPYYEKIQEMYA
jgi:hypothetical protein